MERNKLFDGETRKKIDQDKIDKPYLKVWTVTV
jgi:hypothetical protein